MRRQARPRVVIAGVGNIFLGDDGFGVAVVQSLQRTPLPPGVEIADYGIGGLHLAYDLIDRPPDTLILVDAVPRGEEPGTVFVIETSLEPGAQPGPMAVADGHSLDPETVFQLVTNLGGSLERVVVVGCEPASLDDNMELSEPVAAAVSRAARLALELAGDELGRLAASQASEAS